MTTPRIVVTNDDGIDSRGIRRLYDTLADIGDVTIVAPMSNQSAVGRTVDADAPIEDHPLGFAIGGAPATCIIAASTALGLEPDLVVSGINKGANIGGPMLGRSGTVAAAMEAAHMDIPAIAVSAYIPFERIQGAFSEFEPEPAEYDVAATVTTQLVERALAHDGFEHVDYFNVNTPLIQDLIEPTVRLTIPATGYHTIAERDGERLSLRDRQFELIHTGELPEEHYTDRATLAAGEVSVTPLELPEQALTVQERPTLERVVPDEVVLTGPSAD